MSPVITNNIARNDNIRLMLINLIEILGIIFFSRAEFFRFYFSSLEELPRGVVEVEG